MLQIVYSEALTDLQQTTGLQSSEKSTEAVPRGSYIDIKAPNFNITVTMKPL